MIINKRNFWEGNEISKSFLENLLFAAFDENKSIETIDLTSVFINRGIRRRVRSKVLAQLNRTKSFDVRAEWEFGITTPNHSQDLNVWYTGENLRPPINYDLTLSFDSDDIEQGNIYLPYWLTLFGDVPSGSLEKETLLEKFMIPRQKLANQSLFCAVVINNPHPLRMRAIRELERLGKVDVFGKAIGRPVPDKVQLLEEYRFNLCFENDLYPGYVTEKPFDSWLAGSVPLYWGDADDKYLNQRAVVNLSSFNTMRNYIDHIRNLEHDKELRKEIINSPILRIKPSLLRIIEMLREVVV